MERLQTYIRKASRWSRNCEILRMSRISISCRQSSPTHLGYAGGKTLLSGCPAPKPPAREEGRGSARSGRVGRGCGHRGRCGTRCYRVDGCQSLIAKLGLSFPTTQSAWIDRHLQAARAQLGGEKSVAAATQAQAMSLDQAVNYALEELH